MARKIASVNQALEYEVGAQRRYEMSDEQRTMIHEAPGTKKKPYELDGSSGHFI